MVTWQWNTEAKKKEQIAFKDVDWEPARQKFEEEGDENDIFDQVHEVRSNLAHCHQRVLHKNTNPGVEHQLSVNGLQDSILFFLFDQTVKLFCCCIGSKMFLDAEVNFSRIFLVVLHFLLVEISYQIPICRNM